MVEKVDVLFFLFKNWDPFSASEAVSFLFFFFNFSFGKQKGPRERIDFNFFSEKKVMVGLEELCLPFFCRFFFANAVGQHFLLLEHAV